MIILDSDIKKIQLASDVAGLEWTASWKEITITCGLNCEPCVENFEDQGESINGEVDVVPNPTANTNNKTYSNEVEYLNVYNGIADNANISFQVDNSGTPITLYKITIQPGYNLVYNRESGWKVTDAGGADPGPTPTFEDMTYISLSGTDTYTGTLVGLISYTQLLNKNQGFYVSNPNTGASTVNLNGLGAIPFVKFGASALSNGDISADMRFMAVYDGTSFQIITTTENIVDAV